MSVLTSAPDDTMKAVDFIPKKLVPSASVAHTNPPSSFTAQSASNADSTGAFGVDPPTHLISKLDPASGVEPDIFWNLMLVWHHTPMSLDRHVTAVRENPAEVSPPPPSLPWVMNATDKSQPIW